MPNTKSAERRVRNSARRALSNRRSKTRIKSLERKLRDAIKTGKKDEAAKALQAVSSAFDKAAKSGVVPVESARFGFAPFSSIMRATSTAVSLSALGMTAIAPLPFIGSVLTSAAM